MPSALGDRTFLRMDLARWVDVAAVALEAVGVAVIAGGGLVALLALRPKAGRAAGRGGRYRAYRESLGRAILLGLEFLVAADIIRTVAARPDLRGIAVLGGIVLIRTVLSVSLEMELEGRWPWRRAAATGPRAAPPDAAPQGRGDRPSDERPPAPH